MPRPGAEEERAKTMWKEYVVEQTDHQHGQYAICSADASQTAYMPGNVVFNWLSHSALVPHIVCGKKKCKKYREEEMERNQNSKIKYEVVRHYPHHYLGKQTLQISDDGINKIYKNMTIENQHFHKWDDIDKESYYGKSGYAGWKTFSGIFFFLAVILAIAVSDISLFTPLQKLLLTIIPFFVSIVLFLLQFIKIPYVSFCDQNGNVVFSLHPDKHKEEIKFIEEKLNEKND